MKKLTYSHAEIEGLLSFPTEEIMKYGLEHQLLDSPGLMMHIVLSRILVFQMAKVLPPDVQFDMDTALSLTTVYHATRQASDYGKAGKHKDPDVNEFMKDKLDMEYALQQAKTHKLSPEIIQGIQHYLINPVFREQGYFPHETLEKDGKINWTEAIPMLTSWLIAGVMTRTSKRFQDLRDRRSFEIGVIELPYWKMKISTGGKVNLPEPIVNVAFRDPSGKYPDEASIIQGIIDGEVTDKKFGEWILNGYEEWANKVLSEYTAITGINDLYEFLESGIDTIGDSDPVKKEKIKTEFEKVLGRPIAKGEFIPYFNGIELIFKRIYGLKTESTRQLFQKKVGRSMENIERVTTLLSK